VRVRVRKEVSGDPDRTIEIRQPNQAPKNLTATGGTALAHGGEVAGAGAGVSYGGSEPPGLAKIVEEGSVNTLRGFRPRDRGQRGENGGGRASGGSG
jgi:hypothetical protein